MAAITLKPFTLKRIEAISFTLTVILIVLLLTAAWGASYRFQKTAIITPGNYFVYRMDGYEWSVIHLSIEADNPVTVCITDEVGLRILKAGDGTLCFFKAEGVTELDKVWRFPKNGQVYLVIIPDSEESPISVSLRIKGGLLLW